MKIYYYNGTLWKDVTALDSSFCEETIDRFSRISLDFVLPTEELVPELCHVTWRGDKYTLYTVPKVVKVSTREYRYTLILEGRYKELERTLVKDKLGRTKFVFTGRADQYADLISGCIDGWSTGTCTMGDRTQVIAFSNNSLLDACRMVASKFETEVQMDGGKIAFGRVEKYKGDPLTLAYRQGLQKEITTEPDSKETALGRLYVMGGEHNIDPAKYGSRTLHLPKEGSLSVDGHTFRVDAEGRYISLEGDTRLNTSERALDATTIYPKRVGTISKVEQKGDEWDVIDETNPVDYTQHRVGGDVMRLEFQSGRLAGRSFDLTTKDDKLTGYVHAEKRFRLVRREIDGVLMPEPGTFFPSVGDKYAIFGCSLPDEYIKSAEAEMLSIGARYMAERLEARVQYRAELDGLWAKKNWSAVAHKLTIGTIVRLEGAANDVRISSVRTSLNSPYTPRITFSNAPYMVGSLTTQIATLESAEVRTREETRQVFLHLQARTYEDTKVVREMIDRLRVEGFTQAIKPETLQSMYAVIGSSALQFDFVRGGGAVPFSWSEGKGGTITIPGQSIRRKASGTTLEPGDKTTVTDIPALTYTLKAEERQAYVYTELSPAPHFVISTKPLAISPDRLLVGLLNGEEGKRAFTPLYGFTEITPGQLKTDLIRSQDGKSYWDLLSGKFATTGDLLIGDPKGNTCLAYIDGVLYVKGLTVNVGSSSTTIEEALQEQERKSQKAYDDAVKRAKELDGEIQVGGRNLAIMSRMIPGYLYGEIRDTDGVDSNGRKAGSPRYKVIQYKDFIYDPTYYEWNGATPLTFKLHKGGKSVPIIHYHDKDKVFIGWSFDWTERTAGYTKTLTPPAETAYIRIGFPCSNPVVKIERGTVATDWSPAPEDVQAEIAAAKEQATKAQTSTDKLRGYVDGAYKDGIITEVESKAIATYINEVEAMWSSAFGAYERVYTNSLLTGASKTALADAKITLAGAKDSLISQIKSAISDGMATKAEATETERLYNVYKSALRDFQRALKVAEESIRDATVVEVGSGSLNYLPADVIRSDKNRSLISLRLASGFFRAVPVGVEVPINIGYDVYFANDRTDNNVKTTLFYTDQGDNYKDGSRRYIIVSKTSGLKGRTWHHIWARGKVARLDKHVRIMGWLADTSDIGTYPSEVRDVYLRVGSRDLGWTPAPEDVQAEIDAINANPPRINAGGTWEVCVHSEGKYVDTGRTSKGDDGKAPIIKGDNWWEWDAKAGKYTDTGVRAIGVTGAKGAKGDKGDGLEVIDTRNDNQPPSWYRTKYPRTTVREFKSQSKIGIPSKWIYAIYCTLETTVRWSDTSGGRVEQSTTLDNGVQLRRVGTADDTAWESWINVSAEIRELETGLANTDTLVSALEKAQSKLDQGILTKADTKDIQYLLDSLKNGDTQVAGGLVLSNDIILSDPNSKDVTATISGTQTQGANVMRLGISYTCDEDKKATVERAGAKWGINLSSILTGLESDSDRIRKLDELGFTIVGGRSLGWPKWEICKATDAKDGGEATALANDGTGHIGELYFDGEEIGFGATDSRYMQIGGAAKPESEMVNASTVIRKFGIAGGTVRKSGTFQLDRFDSRYSTREIKYTANLSVWAEARAYQVPDNGGWDPSDHRYHKPEYAEYARTDSSAKVQLRLELTRGGSIIKTVTSPELSVSVTAPGGQYGINDQIPQGKLYAEDRKSQDVTVTISPSDVREQDTVTLSLVTTIRRTCYKPAGNAEIDRYALASASVGDIINYLPYDTSTPMISVAKDRAAFFYGRNKYVLLNYIRDAVLKVVGNILLRGNLTLKGDLLAEYADFPGVPMIGGMVSEDCIFKKSFGRYKNRDGRNFPQVSYDYSSKIYTVYHSIGNDKYIPVVTPMDHRWGDTLSISNVLSYSFQVQLTNGSQDRNKCAFTYVCFKAD